jgi:hypothetical protein
MTRFFRISPFVREYFRFFDQALAIRFLRKGNVRIKFLAQARDDFVKLFISLPPELCQLDFWRIIVHGRSSTATTIAPLNGA